MSSLLLALQISAIGMGLVFAVILLLWGLMYLLTVLAPEKRSALESPAEAVLPAVNDEPRARAAAAAVALALADQGATAAHPLPPPPTAIVSAWQLGMRTRQMHQKGTRYRK
ncbi:MAG: hypothetical protein ACM3QS_06865 [Bacteroidota bacterium]